MLGFPGKMGLKGDQRLGRTTLTVSIGDDS